MNSEETDSYYTKLQKMNRVDLIHECMNQYERADIEHYRAESLEDELESIDTFENEAEELRTLKDLIHKIKTSRERYFLGVESEKDEFDKLLNELLEIDV